MDKHRPPHRTRLVLVIQLCHGGVLARWWQPFCFILSEQMKTKGRTNIVLEENSISQCINAVKEIIL
ncbi:hypothetical protein CAJAP_04038 [Camponotus japonicus]